MADLDFSCPKRETAEEFVDRLQADEGRYGSLAFNMMVELSELTSFPGPRGAPAGAPPAPASAGRFAPTSSSPERTRAASSPKPRSWQRQ
jgi:hypothetical protein